jgi:hypothetical protein
MKAKKFNEFLGEANNMRTLKGFLKELRKEYGPTPTPQSLADFIYNNYEEITGEKLEDSDPASNDHIADIIAHFKMDGEDFAIAWEDRTNESVNEKVKLIMRNILSKMIPAGFGPSTNPKMREEIRSAVQSAIEPILKKYDYVVESKEDIFLDYDEIVGYEFKKFKESYLKLHKDNTIIEDGDILYGVRKGSNEPHWKYFEEDGKLMHSEKNRDVLGLINFFNQVKRNHPWSK